jgi:hypothetical protein
MLIQCLVYAKSKSKHIVQQTEEQNQVGNHVKEKEVQQTLPLQATADKTKANILEPNTPNQRTMRHKASFPTSQP